MRRGEETEGDCFLISEWTEFQNCFSLTRYDLNNLIIKKMNSACPVASLCRTTLL